MKKITLFILLTVFGLSAYAQQAKWITSPVGNPDAPNTWIAFRKDVNVKSLPKQAIAKIAVDSKYWLWINGELAVFEGGLKRGPTPDDTYYDEVDIAPFLKKGENKIALLLWHFGKEGFSHKNSGTAGILFDMKAKGVELRSGNDWICKIHPAFQTAGDPQPNWRLPESNIMYVADREMAGWQTAADCAAEFGFVPAREIGVWGDAPWNALVKRPIPLFKDFGIKDANAEYRRGGARDSAVVRLPFNMQMTAIIEVDDPVGGRMIDITTDHFIAGGDTNLRAQYVTKKGLQQYESLGWLNGDSLFVVADKGVDIKSVKYRQTGYATEPTGTFSCDDPFIMRFWEKALNTLYVNMRDTYYDCPERERSQWWGDVVVLSGESFYTYCPSIHKLTRKGIYELTSWQRPDGALFSPVPAGNWTTELPGQMLASIGWYGFWNYYKHTGDKQTIADAYPAVKRYLSLWKQDETGLTVLRKGDWTWGDWGDNRDLTLLFAGWHYLALKGAAAMADLLDKPEDAGEYRKIMEGVKAGYNKCWNGYAYRHPSYNEKTDDRVQALAVISGIAEEDKYDAIFEVMKTHWHASPYMEKYVMEALVLMGREKFAVERMKKRFDYMVNHPGYTTLFEGWNTGEFAFGGGTVNHAWSGGPLTVIAQYLCGVYPVEPAYKVFRIEPVPATFKTASIGVPSIAGEIKSKFTDEPGKFTLEVTVPRNTTGIICLPEHTGGNITVNGKALKESKYKADAKYAHKTKTTLQLPVGNYTIVAQ